MRVMVTGSRDWREIEVIRNALKESVKIRLIATLRYQHLVQGCASGADAIARSMSLDLGWGAPEDYWPDYARYDFAAANKVRNIAMVDSKPDVVLAFPTKNSRGTWHAVNYAKSQGYVEGGTLLIYGEGEK